MSADASQADRTVNRQPSRLKRILRRKIVCLLLIIFGLLLTLIVYCQIRLSRIPDIGDPFPVADFLQPVPDEENAFLELQQAALLWKGISYKKSEKFWNQAWDGWNGTNKQANECLQRNRPALNMWRKATQTYS